MNSKIEFSHGPNPPRVGARTALLPSSSHLLFSSKPHTEALPASPSPPRSLYGPSRGLTAAMEPPASSK